MPKQGSGIRDQGSEKQFLTPNPRPPISIILGIDPGLQKTGYGVIKQDGNHLSFVACGVIQSSKFQNKDEADKLALSPRLLYLSNELGHVIVKYQPHEAAIEETFVSVNGQSTLKLGQARGALLLTLAQTGLIASEYAATFQSSTQ